MNKPRVAVIIGSGIRTPPEDIAAVEPILKNFLELLEPLSEDIYTIVGDFPFNLPETVQVIKIKGVGRVAPMPISIVRFLLAQLRICYNLCKISKGIDIVILHFGTGPFVLPAFCSRLLGKKTVCCSTGFLAKGMVVQYGRVMFYIVKVLRKIKHYLADQIAVESAIGVKLMGVERFRKKTVINGAMYVDTGLFQINRNAQDRKSLVGYIGRLVEGKGIVNLVRAVPLILERCDDLKFLIVGGGPLFDKIGEELQSRGLSGSVELTGWIPHDELPKYLNQLRLFVFPSYSEGLPGAVQEAMACGAVVVATPVGCVPDLIKDGETGFIMEDNSPQCITGNVIRALEHPRLNEIALNARRLIEQEYTYEVMVEKCRAAFDKLMKNNK